MWIVGCVLLLAVVEVLGADGGAGHVFRDFSAPGSVTALSISGSTIVVGNAEGRRVERLIHRPELATWVYGVGHSEQLVEYYGQTVLHTPGGKEVVAGPYRGVVAMEGKDAEVYGTSCGMAIATSNEALLVGCPRLATVMGPSENYTEPLPHFGLAVAASEGGEVAVASFPDKITVYPAKGGSPTTLKANGTVSALSYMGEKLVVGYRCDATEGCGPLAEVVGEQQISAGGAGPFVGNVATNGTAEWYVAVRYSGKVMLYNSGELATERTEEANDLALLIPAVAVGKKAVVFGTASKVHIGQYPVDGDCGAWAPWLECTNKCGKGTKTRHRTCTAPAPENGGRDCVCPLSETDGCEVWERDWKVGEFGACSTTCGTGIKTRAVWCELCNGTVLPDSECYTAPPPREAQCTEHTYDFRPGVWSGCSTSCGMGEKKRDVPCVRCDGVLSDNWMCMGPPPAPVGMCMAFTYHHNPAEWTRCIPDQVHCGSGVRTRTVACQRCDGAIVDSHFCPPPVTSEWCPEHFPRWGYGGWGDCNNQCGVGQETLDHWCKKCNGDRTEYFYCRNLPKKPTSRSCTKYTYVYDDWGPHATYDCGTTTTRSRVCRRCDGVESPGKCAGPSVETVTNVECPSGGGGGGCLSGSTVVATPFGPKRMDEMEIGEMVLTSAGFRPVIHVVPHSHPLPMLTLVTARGHRVTGTHGHLIRSAGVVVPFSEVKEGMYLAHCTQPQSCVYDEVVDIIEELPTPAYSLFTENDYLLVNGGIEVHQLADTDPFWLVFSIWIFPPALRPYIFSPYFTDFFDAICVLVANIGL